MGRILATTVLVLAAATGRAVEAPPSCVPTARDEEWQAKHAAQLAAAAEREVRVAFLGDSLVEGWARAGRQVWVRDWAPRGACNLGISADRTEHLLWRLEEGGLLDELRPSVVVLQIGTNNLKSGPVRRAPGEVAAGVRRVVGVVRARLPTARILVMAIFPRQPGYDWIDAAIRETNARLCRLEELEGVRVIDLGSHLRLPELRPDPALFAKDLLHLNAAGYAVWSRGLRDAVDAGLAAGGGTP